jgi:hypothetical protein
MLKSCFSKTYVYLVTFYNSINIIFSGMQIIWLWKQNELNYFIKNKRILQRLKKKNKKKQKQNFKLLIELKLLPVNANVVTTTSTTTRPVSRSLNTPLRMVLPELHASFPGTAEWRIRQSRRNGSFHLNATKL